MKRRPVLLVCILSITASLHGWHALPRTDAAGGWNFQTGRHWTQGMLSEYVMLDDYTLSRLDWDMAFWSISAALSVPLSQTLRLQAGYLLSPGVQLSGNMEDRDWANEDAGGYTRDGILSHYSFHDNYLNWNLLIDANIAMQQIQNRTLKLSLLGGIQYSSIKFTSRDGYYEYPAGSPGVPLIGDVITYRVRRMFPYTGFTADFFPESTLSGSVFFTYSPLVFSEAYDEHLLRSLDFIDTVFASQYLSAGVSLIGRFKKISIGLHLTYTRFFFKDGPSYIIYTNINPDIIYLQQNATGGISAAYWEYGLSLAW
jgi:outer membrane protease